MAIFNSYVKLPEGNPIINPNWGAYYGRCRTMINHPQLLFYWDTSLGWCLAWPPVMVGYCDAMWWFIIGFPTGIWMNSNYNNSLIILGCVWKWGVPVYLTNRRATMSFDTFLNHMDLRYLIFRHMGFTQIFQVYLFDKAKTVVKKTVRDFFRNAHAATG